MQTQSKQSWIEGLSQVEGEQCLDDLHRLAGQLNSAMKAIVQRKLSSLHDSLYLQQVSCGRLAELRQRSDARMGQMPGPDAASLDSDLAFEIKQATESLLDLNRSYSALLKHSGDTLQLLAGLYRSYRGFAQPSPGIQASLPTWSCEV